MFFSTLKFIGRMLSRRLGDMLDFDAAPSSLADVSPET
jgi:hypothetical protein